MTDFENRSVLVLATARRFFAPVLSPVGDFADSFPAPAEALSVGVVDQLLDCLLAHWLPRGLGSGRIDHDRSQRHQLSEQGVVAYSLLWLQPLKQLFPYPLAQVYATAQSPGFQPGELFLSHFGRHRVRG